MVYCRQPCSARKRGFFWEEGTGTDSGKYTVRPIEGRDDAQVEAVIRSCLMEFGADREGTAWTDPDLGRFSRLYRGEGNRYWVAEDENGAIVGGAGIGGLGGDGTLCELQKMYCLPRARGTGVARRLMETALAYAKRHYRQCYLETLENMTAAQRFYEKYGFRRIDRPVAETGHFACDVRYLKELREEASPCPGDGGEAEQWI